MKISFLLIAGLSPTVSLTAPTNSPPVQTSAQTNPVTIVTTWGKEYDNAKVTKIDPDGIQISYPMGVAKIPFKQLSQELRKKYGYDPVAAKQFEDDQAQSQAQIDEEEAPKIAAELAREKQQADLDQQQRIAEAAAEKAKENAEVAADQARNLKEQLKEDYAHGPDYGYERIGNTGTYWSDRRQNDRDALAAANAKLNTANQQLRSANTEATAPSPKGSPSYQPQFYQQNSPSLPQQPPLQSQGVRPPATLQSSSTTTIVTTTMTTTTRQVIIQPSTNQANPTP